MKAEFAFVFPLSILYPEMIRDLVEALKALPISHLSAQRPTKLPEQPLEDSFLSQGELLNFQGLQIYLCTLQGCQRHCVAPSSVTFWRIRWNHKSLSLWLTWGLIQAGCKEINWSLLLRESVPFAVAGSRTSNKTFQKKNHNGYETAPLTYKSWDLFEILWEFYNLFPFMKTWISVEIKQK